MHCDRRPPPHPRHPRPQGPRPRLLGGRKKTRGTHQREPLQPRGASSETRGHRHRPDRHGAGAGVSAAGVEGGGVRARGSHHAQGRRGYCEDGVRAGEEGRGDLCVWGFQVRKSGGRQGEAERLVPRAVPLVVTQQRRHGAESLQIRRDPRCDGPAAQRPQPGPRKSQREIRRPLRGPRQRQARNQQPQNLRRRRRLLPVPIHPRRRLHGPHRRPQRALLRQAKNVLPHHPVVHLHHARNRSRRALRLGPCRRGHPPRHLRKTPRRQRPRHLRRGAGGDRAHPRGAGGRKDLGGVGGGGARGGSDQRDHAGDEPWRGVGEHCERDSSVSDAGGRDSGVRGYV
mmetsp:Transcript_5136/g.12378  ORF Transcript_5136/g.12378 Transcript_5136/m.12378 type:complete len:342 (-) Transcript_5136:360-1385(-)